MKAPIMEKKKGGKKAACNISYANHDHSFPLKEGKDLSSSTNTWGKDVCKISGKQPYTGKKIPDEFTQHKLQELKI